MNLTNEKTSPLNDQPSFSKYFQEDDKDEEYNYSDSNINDTLLLQATLLDSNQIIRHKSPSLLNDFRDHSPSISQEKSLVFDLCGELSVSQSNCGSCKTDSQEQSTKQIGDLYGICGKLVETLSQLQNKVQKIEGKESKMKQQGRDLTRNTFQQEIQSRLTYSSLQNSKSCRCEGAPQQKDQKDIIAGLFDLLQSRSQQSSYKEENQELKKQVLRMEIVNEQLRKWSKKTQAENARLKQLLKQCQNFSRRLVVEKQTEDTSKINRKYSHKLLSQRQFGKIKSNASFLDDNSEVSQMNCKMMPSEYYDQRSQQKQNIRIHSDIKYEPCGTQTPPPESTNFFTYSPHQKKRPMTRNFEPQIIFDPQRERQTKQSNIKIVSFQQCKEESACNSPFTRKGVLKPIIENHSKSFRDLKMAKSKNSRNCN